MTRQQEQALKDAAKARKAKKYVYDPVGFDAYDPKTDLMPGARVVKIQPYGCPRNGTMGQCFVGDPDTGAFIGLVSLDSLVAS